MANPHDSKSLRFGNYVTPKFKIGDRVLDECRGMVQIVGVSDGLIQWPIATAIDNRRGRALVLYKDLERAVTNEAGAAITHWWGVSYAAVTKWRKALGIGRSNPGSHELWRASAEGYAGTKARAAALPILKGPEYAAKRREIAKTLPKRKLSETALRKMRNAPKGKKRSPESIAKQVESRRRNNSRSAHGGVMWTSEEDALLRALTIAEVVQKTGKSISAVYRRRQKIGIAKKYKRAGGG